jgi:hypothetical protein
MNGLGRRSSGYLVADDDILEIRHNLVGSSSFGWYSAVWRKEDRCWDALIDINTERLCDVDISIELTDIDMEDNEMCLYVIPHTRTAASSKAFESSAQSWHQSAPKITIRNLRLVEALLRAWSSICAVTFVRLNRSLLDCAC